LDSFDEGKASLTVKGNFCDSVQTTVVLDTSRANLELCIGNNSTANVYNLNDGAYIKGAKPTHYQDVKIDPNQEDKTAIIDKLIDRKFLKIDIKEKITEEKFTSKYLKDFFLIDDAIKLIKNPKNLEEIQENFNEIVTKINAIRETTPIAYWLITGSTQNFLTVIQKYCLAANDEKELQRNYKQGAELFEEFRIKARKLMSDDCLALDDISLEHSYQKKLDVSQ